MFAELHKTLLKKLKVRTLLDLALILPSSYKDTTLSKELKEGSQIVAKVLVKSTNMYGGKLYIKLYLEDFNTTASAVFFRTTPYHTKLFEIGSHHIISGRLSSYRGELQIAQPKSLKSFGVVEGVYKTALKESEVKELIREYITYENLRKVGLNDSEINTLLKMHFVNSLSDIYQKGELKEEHLRNLKAIEAFNYISKLKRKRTFSKPFISLDSGYLDKFINAMPFKLTDDQLSAIDDIKNDISSKTKAAKRMIIGDVGSGKTMVILATAAMAGHNGSILMVPTSILANQIYEESQKYLSPFLKVALVTQKSKKSNYQDADFIVGTHALLYKDDLPKASVVMVDEQHRFGTNQRAMLSALVKRGTLSAHYLQFSATPIPRTQAMIESSAIDISLIKQLPYEKKITTKIIGKADFAKLKEHIEDEIKREYQTLIVYPLVEPSDEIDYTSLTEALPYWQKNFERVYATFGKDSEKDEVLEEFRENGNILLATTVIEVGISLPRLTTIVIVGAERFGLATLHQLRGRVGRYGIDSHCFLYTNAKTPAKRLTEFAKILDGFEIARLDLKYRSSGDLLDGTIQSGKAFRWLDLSEDEDIVKSVKSRLEL